MNIFAQQPEPEAVTGIKTWIQPLIKPFKEMGEGFIEFLPTLAQGFLVLIVGVIIAKIFRAVIAKIGDKSQLDEIATKFGLSDLLGKFGIRAPISKVLSTLIYWVMILVFVKAAADILQIKDISSFINSLIVFLPKLFVSSLILLGGMLVADLVKGVVQSSLDRIEFDYSNLVANFLYGLLAVMILTVVLGQLGIQTELLNSTVKILLGALSLAVAIAMGFGLRPIARNVVSGVYARDLFPPGTVVTIDETEATVVEVGAVATRLELGGNKFFVIPNCQLISQVTQGKHGVSSSFAEKS